VPKPVEPFLAFQDLSVREARSQETWSPESRYCESFTAFGGIEPLFGISAFRGSESRGDSDFGALHFKIPVTKIIT
jgi:hypothetical protein